MRTTRELPPRRTLRADGDLDGDKGVLAVIDTWNRLIPAGQTRFVQQPPREAAAASATNADVAVLGSSARPVSPTSVYFALARAPVDVQPHATRFTGRSDARP